MTTLEEEEGFTDVDGFEYSYIVPSIVELSDSGILNPPFHISFTASYPDDTSPAIHTIFSASSFLNDLFRISTSTNPNIHFLDLPIPTINLLALTNNKPNHQDLQTRRHSFRQMSIRRDHSLLTRLSSSNNLPNLPHPNPSQPIPTALKQLIHQSDTSSRLKHRRQHLSYLPCTGTPL